MDWALIACRFAHFAAAMLLFGGNAFAIFVLPPASRCAARRVDAALVLAALATGLVWFALEAGEAGAGWADAASPPMWAALATGTMFGQVWLWHLGICVALLAGLALPNAPRRVALLAGSAALLASLGLVGHAAMQSGLIGLEHRFSHALHLLASGFWAGSLPALLACLIGLRKPGRRADATLALARFSGLGHIAVAITILTGMLNTALTLGHLPTYPGSPYQELLALKLGLVLLMLSIALVNRYVLTPRLALRGLVIGTAAELVLGTVVVALVSALATFDPV